MPLIIAHRGASKYAPENTFAAFMRAVDAGADGIELDVRLAKDGVAVVFHDPTLYRISGQKKKVAHLTSAELAAVDAGSWFNRQAPHLADAAFTRETVPTLADTLDLLKDFRGRVYIELKCGGSDLERLASAVCEDLRSPTRPENIIVKSFELDAIRKVKQVSPSVRTAALFAPKIRNLVRKDKNVLDLAEAAGADELSLHYTLATRKMMEMAEKRTFPVVVWTADHPRWIRRGIKLGLTAIITNDPERMLKKRREVLG